MTNLTKLPNDLPIPIDDGGAAHLTGMPLPDIALISTSVLIGVQYFPD